MSTRGERLVRGDPSSTPRSEPHLRARPTGARRIDVTIDQLVLSGVSVTDRPVVAAALRAALEQALVRDAEALGGSRSLARIVTASLPAGATKTSADLGTTAGQAIAGSLRA